jgi:protein CpxP
MTAWRSMDRIAISPNPKDKIMMKNWLKRTLVGVAVTGALAGSVAAWSQGPAFHGAPPSADKIAEHQARVLERITKRLKLDAGQQAKLQVLATKLQAAHPAPPAPPARGASAPASGPADQRPDPHARIEALLAGKTFDRAGAQADVNARLAREQAEFTKRTAQVQGTSPALIAAFGDFFDSLNPIQQQQVRDFVADHHGPGFLPGFGGFGGGPGFGPEHRGGHRDHDDRDGHGEGRGDRDGHGDHDGKGDRDAHDGHGDHLPPPAGN